MGNWNEQVRLWMKEQNLNLESLSKKVDIPSRTLSDYFTGKYGLPDERRKILYSVTGLEVLATPVEKAPLVYSRRSKKEVKTNEKDSLYNVLADLESRVSSIKNTLKKEVPKKEESIGKIKEIEDIFYSLLQKMDYLKHTDNSEREKLTKAINSKDVGYFISFVNALYKPDTFNSWIKMSNYIPTKKKKVN